MLAYRLHAKLMLHTRYTILDIYKECCIANGHLFKGKIEDFRARY